MALKITLTGENLPVWDCDMVTARTSSDARTFSLENAAYAACKFTPDALGEPRSLTRRGWYPIFSGAYALFDIVTSESVELALRVEEVSDVDD